MTDQKISGKWRGHYSYYKIPDMGCGFNVSFVEDKDGLVGEIMDDFSPGLATLKGSFQFPCVIFLKVYSQPGYQPIRYEGTMSTDGKSIRGTWEIVFEDYPTRGTWTAYRAESEDQKQSKAAGSKVKQRKGVKATL